MHSHNAIIINTYGAGSSAVVERWTSEPKVPSSNPVPGEPGINVRRSDISDAIMIGCAVCRVARQLSSLVSQYQPVVAGLLQHSALRMLRVSSCPKLTSRDVSEKF